MQCITYKNKKRDSAILFVRKSISFSFSLSVSLQGGLGKPGAPGEVGLQGLPVSMTFNPKISRMTLTACTWENLQRSSLKHCSSCMLQYSNHLHIGFAKTGSFLRNVFRSCILQYIIKVFSVCWYFKQIWSKCYWIPPHCDIKQIQQAVLGEFFQPYNLWLV